MTITNNQENIGWHASPMVSEEPGQLQIEPLSR
jgi:hypothetical protein